MEIKMKQAKPQATPAKPAKVQEKPDARISPKKDPVDESSDESFPASDPPASGDTKIHDVNTGPRKAG
jgi:hypothetical protein